MLPENLAQVIKTWLGLYAHGKAPASEAMLWLTWKESAVKLLKAVLPGEEYVYEENAHNID